MSAEGENTPSPAPPVNPGVENATNPRPTGRLRPNGRGNWRGRGSGRRNGENPTSSNENNHGIPMYQTPTEAPNDRKLHDQVSTKLTSYVIQNYEYGTDVGSLISTLKETVLTKPEDISDDDSLSRVKFYKWQMDFDEHLSRVRTYQENKKILFQQVLDLCSKHMKTTLTGLEGYEDAKLSLDPIWLLKGIKGISFKFEATLDLSWALADALHKIMSFKQGNMSNDDYYKEFLALVAVYEQYGAKFGHSEAFVKKAKEMVLRDSLLAKTNHLLESEALELLRK